jgi:8-oxo-dGTP pyrophosphatase MutT (NUDIX family)
MNDDRKNDVPRAAAVAIIEIAKPDREVLVLRRSASKKDHWSAQYAFPGGRCQTDDGSPLSTAIRETSEECGIELSPAALVETLPTTPAARSTKHPVPVHPFHFLLDHRPSLTLQQREIQGACWVKIADFLRPNGHAMREMMPGRLPGRYYPSWPLADYYLWGFTYELTLRIFGDDNMLKNLPVAPFPSRPNR